MMQGRQHTSGFTLIELMITVAIVALLVTITLPSYQSHTERTRRSDAKTILAELALRMEHYHLIANTYAGATLADVGIPATSEHGWYTVAITTATANTYLITATPQNSQTNDTTCANFTLTNAGVKGISGTGTAASCWQ